MIGGQCGTISACRDDYDWETNMKQTKHLKSLLRALYSEVDFIFIVDSCQQDASKVPSHEVSFLSIRSKALTIF